MQMKTGQESGLSGAASADNAATSQRLLELGIDDTMLSAIALLPLFEVAWCDGALDQPEREQLEAAVADAGFPSEAGSQQLLNSWFRARPAPKFFEAWKLLAGTQTLSDVGSDKATSREWVLEHANRVAHASGGIMGFVKMSYGERCEIRHIERAMAA